MKIAICDAEKDFLNTLKVYLQENFYAYDKVDIIEYDSGEKLLKYYKYNKFDVIILEIELNGLSGLDVARKIRKIDSSVIIVFMTTHQEFAVKGYEVNAFRYFIKGQSEHFYLQQIMSIFNEYSRTHISFPVKTHNAVINTNINDIMYFEVYKRTIIVHTISEDYCFYGKLLDIESNKRLITFVKPHKSYYVNINYISRIESKIIIMKNGETIPLSRNFKNKVNKCFCCFMLDANK